MKICIFAKFQNPTTNFFDAVCSILPFCSYSVSLVSTQMSEPCYESIKVQDCQFGFFEARFWLKFWLFSKYLACFEMKKARFYLAFFSRKGLGSGKTLSELHIHLWRSPPKTPHRKQKICFSILTTRLAESVEGFNSSLAQSPGEL